jgi:hypothetical protein
MGKGKTSLNDCFTQAGLEALVESSFVLVTHRYLALEQSDNATGKSLKERLDCR